MNLSRRVLSAVLTALVCFFAIALFSPLHVHRNHQCSLNNLEYQIADSVAPVLVLPPPVVEGLAALVESAPAPAEAHACARVSRGPPSVFPS